MIIAIDGTAGSGKGTLAKNLSSKLNLKHLDTGILYRIVSSQAISLHISNNDKRLIDLCKNLTVDNVEKTRISEGKKLRSNDIGKKASEIALNPSIRNELINLQRKYAKFDRSLYNGIILDGRDIGTVVFPNADYKFFLIASVESRVNRRYVEFSKKNINISKKEIKANLISRDKNDIERLVSPLIKADDAIEIDTTNMSIVEQVNKIYNKIR